MRVPPPILKKPPTSVRNEPMATDTVVKGTNHSATEAGPFIEGGFQWLSGLLVRVSLGAKEITPPPEILGTVAPERRPSIISTIESAVHTLHSGKRVVK